MKPNNPWKNTTQFIHWEIQPTSSYTCGDSSPFDKGGLRGIFVSLQCSNPPSPPFSKVGNWKEFRIGAAFLLLTLFGLHTSLQAAELGRLFYTPQQRQQLEFQEANNSSEDSVRRNYIIVNGVVQKNGGNRTVWINGTEQAAERGNDKNPSTVPVAVPGKSRPVQLKVGQRLLLDNTAPEEEK